MTKFLGIWLINGTALPPDPSQQAQGIQMIFGQIDAALKEGQIEEFGFFPNGSSGYAILSGETKDAFGAAISFFPWLESEVHEMVPYETGKQMTLEVLKYQMEAMKR